MGEFTVIKRDAYGKPVLTYSGVLAERNDQYVCIDAVFALDDRDLGYVQLCRGDRFREWFYADQWFNIFRVQDGATLALKGWYCNITRPPKIADGSVTADDLCLDVFVYPDGKTLLLDEEDFNRLQLSGPETAKAWQAVQELETWVTRRLPPFDEVVAAPGAYASP